MARYAALLRGVSPMNCKMADLKMALEKAGFADVKTVISSGNAVFTARKAQVASLEKKCEAAFGQYLDKPFLTIVRPIEDLEKILATDPFKESGLPTGAKRDVTFLRAAPKPKLQLPLELRGAAICALHGDVAFSYHVPNNMDPAFMVLIEKTFGKEVTTRTWETVGRIVKAGSSL